MKNKTREIQNAVSNMKHSVLRFAKRVSEGLKKPRQNFIADMLYGMMVSQDVKLTEIGKALKEDMELKYTEERLRRNTNTLSDEETKIASDNYMKKVMSKCRKDTLLLVDGGDISKPYGSNFEGLCDVRDGSTGKIGKGLPTVGVIALTDDKLPLPVYERIYSYSKDFVSENHETFKALDFADEHFSKDNIRVFDRGYDSNIVTEKLLDSKVKFIVRLCERTVVYKGKKIGVTELASQFKGKYKLDFVTQKGKKKHCKVSIIQIELPQFPGETFNLVICNGYAKEPMILITNVFNNDNAICTTIVKCYLLRWKIEEFYRFKKETFNFEDIRVMSLQGMNNLNFLLNVLIGFLAMKSTEGKDKPIIVSLINQVKRIYDPKNWLYTVCAGVKTIFAIVNTGITERQPDLICGFEQLCFVLHEFL